ncbi:phage tail protein [Marinimicrobium sp. ARAG 43.8]|uniref:phage tail protein n=1 Tax=Marinimicrobium sp. ARAG 43.8 TaxID=3418719 RepID=UPI003CF7A59A
MAEPYIAQIQIWGASFAPQNWAHCDGAMLPIAQFSALFSIISNTFGGDGQTSVGLPNMQGRAPLQWGTAPGLTPRAWGETAGQPEVTLLQSEMPAHTHELVALNDVGNSQQPQPGGYLARDAFSGQRLRLAGDSLDSPVNMHPNTLAPVGGQQAHENRQPYLAMSFCIALMGQFPSRS